MSSSLASHRPPTSASIDVSHHLGSCRNLTPSVRRLPPLDRSQLGPASDSSSLSRSLPIEDSKRGDVPLARRMRNRFHLDDGIAHPSGEKGFGLLAFTPVSLSPASGAMGAGICGAGGGKCRKCGEILARKVILLGGGLQRNIGKILPNLLTQLPTAWEVGAPKGARRGPKRCQRLQRNAMKSPACETKVRSRRVGIRFALCKYISLSVLAGVKS